MAFTTQQEDVVREINKRLSLCLVQGPGNAPEGKRNEIAAKMAAALAAQPKDPRQDLRATFKSLCDILGDVDKAW